MNKPTDIIAEAPVSAMRGVPDLEAARHFCDLRRIEDIECCERLEPFRFIVGNVRLFDYTTPDLTCA